MVLGATAPMVLGATGNESFLRGSLVVHSRHFLKAHRVIGQGRDCLKSHMPSGHDFQDGFVSLWGLRDGPGDAHHGADYHGLQHPSLFRKRDLIPWMMFATVVCTLVILDNCVMHRKAEKVGLVHAILYTTFWISCGCFFCLYIFYIRGPEDALTWGTGYLLEWTLSIDNVFIFHRVFEVFRTPEEQKHKPLFCGVIGAIVFRMIFFCTFESMMMHIKWIHIVLGAFLIYMGIKAVAIEEAEDNPDQGWFFKQLLKQISYVDKYDSDGKFFTQMEVDQDANTYTGDRLEPETSSGQVVVEWKATRLVVVVLCLEITDLIFAVDSISAIVAQIPDLFLAYSACIFAMLGLRALFFALDELVKIFSLLFYGVGFILIFLGLQLMLRTWIHVPRQVVCFILLGVLFVCVFASVVRKKMMISSEAEDVDAPQRTNGSSVR